MEKKKTVDPIEYIDTYLEDNPYAGLDYLEKKIKQEKEIERSNLKYMDKIALIMIGFCLVLAGIYCYKYIQSLAVIVIREDKEVLTIAYIFLVIAGIGVLAIIVNHLAAWIGDRH